MYVRHTLIVFVTNDAVLHMLKSKLTRAVILIFAQPQITARYLSEPSAMPMHGFMFNCIHTIASYMYPGHLDMRPLHGLLEFGELLQIDWSRDHHFNL